MNDARGPTGTQRGTVKKATVLQMNDSDHGGLQTIEIEYDETCCQDCYLPNGSHDVYCPNAYRGTETA